MIIERLSFQIIPADRVDDFLDADEKVWTEWLKQQRGFVRKVPTIYPNGRVDLRIYWATKRDLDAASKSPEIPAIDVKMQSQFLGVAQRLPS